MAAAAFMVGLAAATAPAPRPALSLRLGAASARRAAGASVAERDSASTSIYPAPNNIINLNNPLAPPAPTSPPNSSGYYSNSAPVEMPPPEHYEYVEHAKDYTKACTRLPEDDAIWENTHMRYYMHRAMLTCGQEVSAEHSSRLLSGTGEESLCTGCLNCAGTAAGQQCMMHALGNISSDCVVCISSYAFCIDRARCLFQCQNRSTECEHCLTQSGASCDKEFTSCSGQRLPDYVEYSGNRCGFNSNKTWNGTDCNPSDASTAEASDSAVAGWVDRRPRIKFGLRNGTGADYASVRTSYDYEHIRRTTLGNRSGANLFRSNGIQAISVNEPWFICPSAQGPDNSHDGTRMTRSPDWNYDKNYIVWSDATG